MAIKECSHAELLDDPVGGDHARSRKYWILGEDNRLPTHARVREFLESLARDQQGACGLPAPGFFDCARSRVDFSSWEIAAFG